MTGVKKMDKHVLAKLMMVVGIFLWMGMPIAQAADETIPPIHGEFGASIDASTGELLYEKNADEKAYPASTTKVLTAMLLIDNVKDGDILTASKESAEQEASNYSFKLQPGDQISKEDALNALIVVSANDVAMTVAEHVGGSKEGFAKMMNEKAKKIGMKNTHFVSPSGLHDPDHYSTAHDMALLGREALQYPALMAAMGMKTTKVTVTPKSGDAVIHELENPSQIHENPIALGGKTGYTNTAQNTLLEILEKDHKRVVTVVMKTTLAEEYKDIDIMTQHAISQIQSKQVVKKGEVIKHQRIEGHSIQLLAADDFSFSYKKGDEEKVERRVEVSLPKNGIEKNEIAGKVEYFYKGEKIQEIDLLSDRAIVPETGSDNVLFWFGIFLPIPFYVIYVLYRSKRKKAFA